MDYNLENLGPERFQEFCQALLLKVFPKTQCYPVGQRDGGRDATTYFPLDSEKDGFVVFQVKFVRKPLAEKSPHLWIKEIVEAEAPKIAQLIQRGAKEYYLLTNVPGTAYLDSGSIDSVQKALRQHIAVPAQCWWRDDINRRLDVSWDIKWSYPDILNGPDVLRHIIEQGLSEDAERRTSTIRAFIRDQFERDTEVRFKQVELQNKLLDLFIDVPVSLRQASAVSRHERRRETAALNAIAQQFARESTYPHDSSIGAATLLLHPLAQQYLGRIVLEGAPGQGKSTITQYLCQVHRSRVLREGENDQRVPEQHRSAPARLPFKIDCRDFSLWLTKQNPFSADDQSVVPEDWHKSVESFLAAQITHYSGGATFTVSDLHAVVRLSAILLVFDGLDEVADITRRREVIEFIVRGANRLQELALSLQTIVTSRPTAFADSPGFPDAMFRYFHLAAIDKSLIDQYAEKWLKARRLEGKEATVVRRILRDKLDQPHLRELARNPMQLAILLSLVQTRGGSLPDKRTALYDSYVELFFNREAEKSVVVRDHRDLLLDIHRYVAWVLHSESQTKQNRGAISTERLRELVEEYLSEEGHDARIAAQLFTGMIERVVALVSRVEGTYEFEVQPLREYFAARHLYNTAPYSPTGMECGGTLPERFDALCRDFFWLNVTRFYAGCYSKGELPSLVDRLEELAKSPGYQDTNYPQSLAATLLSDWVFAQHPKSMRQVVALLLDDLGLRFVTSRNPRLRREEPLVLPKQCGNEELVVRCFELLERELPADYCHTLCELIRANASREGAIDRWYAVVSGKSGSKKTKWIQHGLRIGTLSGLSNEQLECLLSDGSVDLAVRLTAIARAGQSKIIHSNQEYFTALSDYVLDGAMQVTARRSTAVVDLLSQFLNPFAFALAFENRGPEPLRRIWQRMYVVEEGTIEDFLSSIGPEYDLALRCREVIVRAIELSERPCIEWSTQLGPWESIVELGRSHFGERWILQLIANCAAGIRSKDAGGETADRLFEQEVSLCQRVRYARLRAGVPKWWESQLQSAGSQNDIRLALLVFLNWAGSSVVARHIGIADQLIRALDQDTWLSLSRGLRYVHVGLRRDRAEGRIGLPSLPKGLSERTLVALADRLPDKLSQDLFQSHLADYDGDDPAVLQYCHQSALRAATAERGTWKKWLPLISQSYTKGAIHDSHYAYRYARLVRRDHMPISIAEEIVRNCASYPLELVALAEQVCRTKVAEKVVAVGSVADRQRWFA